LEKVTSDKKRGGEIGRRELERATLCCSTSRWERKREKKKKKKERGKTVAPEIWKTDIDLNNQKERMDVSNYKYLRALRLRREKKKKKADWTQREGSKVPRSNKGGGKKKRRKTVVISLLRSAKRGKKREKRRV